MGIIGPGSFSRSVILLSKYVSLDFTVSFTIVVTLSDVIWAGAWDCNCVFTVSLMNDFISSVKLAEGGLH